MAKRMNFNKSVKQLLEEVETELTKLDARREPLMAKRRGLMQALGKTVTDHGETPASHADDSAKPRRGRKSVAARATGRRRAAGGSRLDWNGDVLVKLDKTFTMQDVLKSNKAVAAKGAVQVYPAIKRWISAKLVRRLKDGTLERLGASYKIVAASEQESKPAASRKSSKPAKRTRTSARRKPEAEIEEESSEKAEKRTTKRKSKPATDDAKSSKRGKMLREPTKRAKDSTRSERRASKKAARVEAPEEEQAAAAE